MITQLVYTSKCQMQGEPTDIAFGIKAIADISRRNNARVGITGTMTVQDGIFAQVLEGPGDAIETVLERLGRDRRHSDMVVHAKWRDRERVFSRWSMALVGAQGSSLVRIAPADLTHGLSLRVMTGDGILKLLEQLSHATHRALA